MLSPVAAFGKPCKTGCNIATHDIDRLDDATIMALVDDLSNEDQPGPDSPALEALLFHADSVRIFLDQHGPRALGRHHTLLMRQLAVTHAVIEIKVVDETGRIRAQFAPTRVPLGRKTHHLATKSHELHGLEVSGTVVRVGLEHVWSRL